MRLYLILLVLSLLGSCATNPIDLEVGAIKAAYVSSIFGKRPQGSKIRVHELSITESRTEFFQNLGYEINVAEYDEFEITNLSIEHWSPSSIKDFRVFKRCVKNGCEYKFIMYRTIFA
jgi:hypothetical protein